MMGQMWLRRALSPRPWPLHRACLCGCRRGIPWLHIGTAVTTVLIVLPPGRKHGQRWGSPSPWSCEHWLGAAEHAPCSHCIWGVPPPPARDNDDAGRLWQNQPKPLLRGTKAVAETPLHPCLIIKVSSPQSVVSRPVAPGEVGNTSSQAHPRRTESKTLQGGALSSARLIPVMLWPESHDLSEPRATLGTAAPRAI